MKRLNDDETFLLISFVQTRECLWNESNADFKRISVTRKLWNEIGDNLNISGDEAKCKWRNLRDKFKKLVRQSNPNESNPDLGSQWKFYNGMFFLKDSVQPDQTGDNFSAITVASGSEKHNIAEDFQEYNFDFLITKTTDEESSMSSARKRNHRATKRKRVDDDVVMITPSNKSMDNVQQSEANKFQIPAASTVMGEKKTEDDYYFLMSLLPYIQTLNSIEKLELRSRMQDLVTDSYRKHDFSKRSKMNH